MLTRLTVTLALAVLPVTGPPDDLAVRDQDGRVILLSELRGRVVLLDVWATWCAPCLAELPTLRRLHEAHGQDLAVVGISLDRMTRRDFVSWLRRHDVTWPQHFDGRSYASPVAVRLGVDALPASFLLDRRGRLAARDLRGTDLERAVSNLVAAEAK